MHVGAGVELAHTAYTHTGHLPEGVGALHHLVDLEAGAVAVGGKLEEWQLLDFVYRFLRHALHYHKVSRALRLRLFDGLAQALFPCQTVAFAGDKACESARQLGYGAVVSHDVESGRTEIYHYIEVIQIRGKYAAVGGKYLATLRDYYIGITEGRGTHGVPCRGVHHRGAHQHYRNGYSHHYGYSEYYAETAYNVSVAATGIFCVCSPGRAVSLHNVRIIYLSVLVELQHKRAGIRDCQPQTQGVDQMQHGRFARESHIERTLLLLIGTHHVYLVFEHGDGILVGGALEACGDKCHTAYHGKSRGKEMPLEKAARHGIALHHGPKAVPYSEKSLLYADTHT